MLSHRPHRPHTQLPGALSVKMVQTSSWNHSGISDPTRAQMMANTMNGNPSMMPFRISKLTTRRSCKDRTKVTIEADQAKVQFDMKKASGHPGYRAESSSTHVCPSINKCQATGRFTSGGKNTVSTRWTACLLTQPFRIAAVCVVARNASKPINESSGCKDAGKEGNTRTASPSVLGRLRQQRGLHSAGSIAGPDEQGRRRQRHRHMRLPTEDDLAGDVQELGQAQDHVQGTRDGVDMACIRHRPHVAQRPGFEHLVPLLLPLCHFRIVHLRLRCDRLAIHQGRAEPLPMESGLRLAHRETITPSLQLVEGVQFPVRRVQALLLLPGRPTCDTSICAAADHSQHGPRPAPARSSAPGAAERGGGCGQRAARGCCDEGALRALLRQGAATASCDGSWSERSQHAAWSARHACACAQSWNHHRRCTCRVVCLAANGLNHRAERNS
mmetsp:Transcript_154136/g.492992  ORF Transcript_154136/g.492992 Transcript_154136/m.492992 type:complete len:443 (+) Transcript_154136:111-1439(+)